MHALIEAHREQLLSLARRRGVWNVRVFGSMVHGGKRADSDVDLLVTLALGISALARGGLLLAAQEVLGRRVDVVTEASLHPALRDRSRVGDSRLVQDAVIRNLQTVTELSQRLSAGVKAMKPQLLRCELAGFRNVIVHGQLGIDLAAVWFVVDQDLPPLAAALACMVARTCHTD